MLSNASKYAVRAVLFLADKSDASTKYSAKAIGEELEIPVYFIAKLLQQLVKAGLVSSSKGPKGGFYLSEENLQNNACKILHEIDGEDVFSHCFMGLPRCGDKNPCPVHHIVSPFKDKLMAKFQKQSIKELSDEIDEKGMYLSLKDS